MTFKTSLWESLPFQICAKQQNSRKRRTNDWTTDTGPIVYCVLFTYLHCFCLYFHSVLWKGHRGADEFNCEISIRIDGIRLFVSFSQVKKKKKNEKMNAPPPVYASSCPALQSNLSLHSSSYYSEYSGGARRRLSSTGEADTSATSSYEGSDSSENSDESRLEPVSQMEREQLETFFRGLKSQVSYEATRAFFQKRA